MRSLFLLVALSACGDNSFSSEPDAGLDADPQPDAACPPARMPQSDPAFEALVQSWDGKTPGMGIAVLQDGVVVHQAVFGRREAFSCEPFTANTRIRLGRSARTLVSLAAMAAISDGKLALAEPVATYVPGFHVTNGDASAITIRRLLDHSAGLYVPDFRTVCPSQNLRQYWSTVDAKLEFSPGTAVGNFDEELSLLGAAVEAVEGKPYRQVIAERIFTPLGMHSTFDHDEFLAGDHGRGGPSLEDPPTCATWEPVDQVYVSLDDLVRLATFLSQGNTAVLSADKLATVHDANAAHHAKEYSTGYGMESLEYDQNRARAYFTDGELYLSGAEIDVFDDGFTSVMIENGGQPTYSVADSIIAKMSAHDFVNHLAPLPKTRWSEYTGTWHDSTSSPSRTLTIAFDGTKLVATFNGIPAPLSAFGEDSFDFALFGSHDRVRFWRDGNGITQLITSQLGNLGPAFQRVP
jgi:CubicO group peptidase (beta-lactamase class C family)